MIAPHQMSPALVFAVRVVGVVGSRDGVDRVGGVRSIMSISRLFACTRTWSEVFPVVIGHAATNHFAQIKSVPVPVRTP